MLQQTCLRINRYPVDRNSTCYTTLRLVPTEIIVIVLVKELGKSVLFWIIRKVPTLVLEIPNTTFSHKLYKPWSSRINFDPRG